MTSDVDTRGLIPKWDEIEDRLTQMGHFVVNNKDSRKMNVITAKGKAKEADLLLDQCGCKSLLSHDNFAGQIYQRECSYNTFYGPRSFVVNVVDEEIKK